MRFVLQCEGLLQKCGLDNVHGHSWKTLSLVSMYIGSWLYKVLHNVPLIQALGAELIRLMSFFFVIFQVDYIMFQSTTFNSYCHYNKFTQGVSCNTIYNLYTYSSYSCNTEFLLNFLHWISGIGIFCGFFTRFF